jgi:ADP-ribosyltransferase exoenzyme/Phage Mu protein F like protein
MRRVVGLTSDELETRERVFDGLTTRAIRRALRTLTADVDSLVTAAVTLSETPPPPNPTIPAGALGVVTTTWTTEVDDVLFPYVVQTFVDAADDIHAVLPDAVPKITYDLATTFLANARNRLAGIGDHIWSDMRTQLALGYEAGESIEQLATRIRGVAKISEPRAKTVARTEVVPAANFGSLQQLKVAGFTDEECQKEWLATNDVRTREAHRLADGQRVGVSQPFQVDGDFLQVPGDPAGRADNVINCRCTVAYVFAGDEEEDDKPVVADGKFERLRSREHAAACEGHRHDAEFGFCVVESAAVSHGNHDNYELMTAAKHHTPDANWDESQVKRDTKGQFAEKVGVKVPLHINTKVIYTTKYSDGAVVAEGNVPGTGEPQRLIWDANMKKFLLQGQLEDHSWLSVESYTKKDAYAKFSKETGWTKPDKVSVAVTAPKSAIPKMLANMSPSEFVDWFGTVYAGKKDKWDELDALDQKVILDKAKYTANTGQGNGPLSVLSTWGATAKKTPIVIKEMKEVAPLGKPIYINTVAVYKTKYADGAVMAERIAPDGTKERLRWDADIKKFHYQEYVDNHWSTMEMYNKNETYQKFSKQTGWTLPVAKLATPVPTPTSPAPTSVPKAVGAAPGHVDDYLTYTPYAAIAHWLKGLTDADLAKYDTTELEKIKDKLADVLNAGNIHYNEAIPLGEKIDKAMLPSIVQIPDFFNDSAIKISGFYAHLTQDDFDSLSASDQALVAHEAPFYDAMTGSKKSYSEKIADFIAGKGDDDADKSAVTMDFNDVSGPEGMTPVKYNGVDILYAKSASDGSGAFFYTVNSDGSKGAYTGSINFEDNENLTNIVNGMIKSGILNVPANTTPTSTLVTPVSTPLVHFPLSQTDWPKPDSLVFTGDTVGSHGSQIYKDKKTGTRYLFKRYPSSDFLAEIDVTTADLQTQFGLPTARITKMTLNGTPGTLHEMIPNAQNAFSGGFNPTSLLPGDVLELQKNQVFDWLISNHDAHAQNFVKAEGKLVAVDKGQAFKYLGRDKLDVNFKPNEHPTVYNTLMKAYAAGEIDLNDPATGELHDFIMNIKALPDDEYRAALRPYAEKAAQQSVLGIYHNSPGVSKLSKFPPNDVEKFLDAAVQRKNDLASDFLSFYSKLTAEKNKNLGITGVKTPKSVPSAPTAPTLGPIKASDLKKPMKITTGVIHTTKYQHGTVVAYHKDDGTGLSRLVWSDNTKKFVLQKLIAGKWENFTGHSKKDAYASFGKQVNWFEPPPGDTAIGTGGVFGATSVMPSISTSGSTPSTAVTAPVAPSKPQSKFDVATLQAQHGQIPTSVSTTKRSELFDHFKKKTPAGAIYLSSSETSMFEALHQTVIENDNLSKISSLITPLNMLQVLKIIDEEATNRANAIAVKDGKPSVTNQNLYEKKLVAWLQTPAGAKFATDLLHPPPPAVAPNGVTYKSNFSQEVLNTLAKIKSPGQIGTSDASAKSFKKLTPTTAQQLQSQMLATDPWTSAQKAAIAKYSGQYYSTMNSVVRDLVKSTKYQSDTDHLTAARTAVNIQAGMRPLPESVQVFRKTGASQFPGLTDISTLADVKKLEGQLFVDRAPLSTSVTQGTWTGKVHLTIDLPAGTPAAFIKSISHHKSEDEMLLALGLKYRVVSVTDGSYGNINVHLRVEA